MPEDLVDEVFAELKRPGTGRAFIAFQKYEMGWCGPRTVYMDRLSEIQAPTLLIHGSKDTLAPLEASRQAQTRFANTQLYILEDCGHWSQSEDPETFNRVLRSFLDA
jgi:pimeloyl-ACP methyl ester carboxylesterase